MSLLSIYEFFIWKWLSMHGRLSMSPLSMSPISMSLLALSPLSMNLLSMASLSMSHEYLGFLHKGTRDIMK